MLGRDLSKASEYPIVPTRVRQFVDVFWRGGVWPSKRRPPLT